MYVFHVFFLKNHSTDLSWWYKRNSISEPKSNILYVTGLNFDWLKRFCIKCCLIINQFLVVVIPLFYFIICNVILDSWLWQLMGMWPNLLSHAKAEWLKGQRQPWTKLWSWQCVFLLPYVLVDLAMCNQARNPPSQPPWLCWAPHHYAARGLHAFITRKKAAYSFTT